MASERRPRGTITMNRIELLYTFLEALGWNGIQTSDGGLPQFPDVYLHTAFEGLPYNVDPIPIIELASFPSNLPAGKHFTVSVKLFSRYICSGLHLVTISSLEDIARESQRLSPWVARPWFESVRLTSIYELLHPECCNWKGGKSPMPYTPDHPAKYYL